MSSRVAELQVLLEGIALPASKQELLRYAGREDGDTDALALLATLQEREYSSIDEVGEMLYPVQPSSRREAAQPEPEPESGLPPGGSAYTDPSEEPGWVRERP